MPQAQKPMIRTPYWLDTSQPGPDRSRSELPKEAEVVIIGAGLTGLSTALHLARLGVHAVVLERETVGFGASGRNGGMCTTGASISFGTLITRYGVEAAKRIWLAYDEAINLVERLVTEEGIDCNFVRSGKMSLASKPQHVSRLQSTCDALAKHLNYETKFLPRSALRSEIGSDVYFGGLVDERGAGLHVGKFVRGLGDAAVRAGAEIHERANVVKVDADTASIYAVRTNRGTIQAAQVVVATDGYTEKAVRRLQRRIVPVGSFVIATQQLDISLVDELLPTRRMAVDSKRMVHYFRITPDNRLLMGGRPAVSQSTERSDLRSSKILRRDMRAIFPQVADSEIEYAWGGHVGMTLDRIPHAGIDRGMYYSLGYNGHGVQMSTYMGRQMADMLSGSRDANPWAPYPFRAIPGYFGKPWFLPITDLYYRYRDLTS
jgi:glycine/D-amino acid oxidase-like deaminating enzyme